jgi:hypothetical protein
MLTAYVDIFIALMWDQFNVVCRVTNTDENSKWSDSCYKHSLSNVYFWFAKCCFKEMWRPTFLLKKVLRITAFCGTPGDIYKNQANPFQYQEQ